MAHSHDWQISAGCHLVAQPCWGPGASVPLLRGSLHGLSSTHSTLAVFQEGSSQENQLEAGFYDLLSENRVSSAVVTGYWDSRERNNRTHVPWGGMSMAIASRGYAEWEIWSLPWKTQGVVREMLIKAFLKFSKETRLFWYVGDIIWKKHIQREDIFLRNFGKTSPNYVPWYLTLKKVPM